MKLVYSFYVNKRKGDFYNVEDYLYQLEDQFSRVSFETDYKITIFNNVTSFVCLVTLEEDKKDTTGTDIIDTLNYFKTMIKEFIDGLENSRFYQVEMGEYDNVIAYSKTVMEEYTNYISLFETDDLREIDVNILNFIISEIKENLPVLDIVVGETKETSNVASNDLKPSPVVISEPFNQLDGILQTIKESLLKDPEFLKQVAVNILKLDSNKETKEYSSELIKPDISINLESFSFKETFVNILDKISILMNNSDKIENETSHVIKVLKDYYYNMKDLFTNNTANTDKLFEYYNSISIDDLEIIKNQNLIFIDLVNHELKTYLDNMNSIDDIKSLVTEYENKTDIKSIVISQIFAQIMLSISVKEDNKLDKAQIKKALLLHRDEFMLYNDKIDEVLITKKKIETPEVQTEQLSVITTSVIQENIKEPVTAVESIKPFFDEFSKVVEMYPNQDDLFTYVSNNRNQFSYEALEYVSNNDIVSEYVNGEKFIYDPMTAKLRKIRLNLL